MAYIYRKNDPKKKRRVVILIFILILAGVLTLSIAGGFFGSDYVVRKSLEGQEVVTHVAVSGGDVIVTIYGGRKAEELQMISMTIDGVPQSSEHPLDPPLLNGAGVVVFPGVCDGVTGTRIVTVRGVFADESTMLLKQVRFRFT